MTLIMQYTIIFNWINWINSLQKLSFQHASIHSFIHSFIHSQRYSWIFGQRREAFLSKTSNVVIPNTMNLRLVCPSFFTRLIHFTHVRVCFVGRVQSFSILLGRLLILAPLRPSEHFELHSMHSALESLSYVHVVHLSQRQPSLKHTKIQKRRSFGVLDSFVVGCRRTCRSLWE
jgi:hypothetical protein